MRWSTFAAVAILGLILQTTLAPRLAVGGVRPDWVFVLVVFFGLYGARRDAWLAGWVLGLGADLASIERMGLFAIAYCLVAVVVNAVRDMVFLKNPATHFSVTLAAGLLLQAGLLGYRAVVYPNSMTLRHPAVLQAGCVALYTALWAILIHHLMLKASQPLGLRTSRYTHRGLAGARRPDHATRARTGGAHV
ncbi:MAG: rod shape-determining protein MreD [Phycisphaerae bacterium]